LQQVNEASKNHQDDEETLENCGQIPYLDMAHSTIQGLSFGHLRKKSPPLQFP
jgi:hypothetical protein